MKIVYGPKGTGKTKIVIDEANGIIDSAKGNVVFITDTNRYMYDLKYQIRFIDLTNFGINNESSFEGFVKGIVAANHDNEFVYIDGISRIIGKPLSELEELFNAIEKLEKDFDVSFIFTCSCDKNELPEFIKKYVD